MKEEFTDKEEELVDRLEFTGMDGKNASMLVYAAGRDGCTRRELEEALDLSQPQVSVGMQELRDKGWVGKDKKETEGKGRPLHIYRLDVPMVEVVEEIENDEMDRIEEIERNLDRFEDLSNEILKKT